MTYYAYDFDYYEPEPEPEPETKPAYEPTVSDHPKDEADDAFPVLSNLEPNGYVPGFGVLDEEYVRFENIDGSVNYLYCTDGMWNRTNEWWIDSAGVHFEGGVVITDYYYAPNSDYETGHFPSDPYPERHMMRPPTPHPYQFYRRLLKCQPHG